MRESVIGRLFGIALSVGGWLLVGARVVLDLVGYSTAPDDAVVATGLMKSFLLWLLNIPWWVPWAFAFSTTLLLSYVFWPRAVLALDNTHDKSDDEPDQITQLILLGNECLELSKDILIADKRSNLYRHHRSIMMPTLLELAKLGINVPAYDERISDSQNVNKAAEFLAVIGQFLKNERLEDAKWYANDRLKDEDQAPQSPQDIPEETQP